MIYVGWSSGVAPRTNALHNAVSMSSVQYLLTPVSKKDMGFLFGLKKESFIKGGEKNESNSKRMVL